MNIKQTNEITNDELWRNTHQKPIANQIKRRKWNQIGHTLRKEVGTVEKTALDWNPQGYRRRGRPKRMWRRTIEDENKEQEDHGMRSREQMEIAMPGSSSWMPYAPQRVRGLVDDEWRFVLVRV